jgi:NADH-quinone oxidoreductase subunit E
MLTPEEQREIEEEAVHFPVRRAACIDALRVVQKHRGWVSDDAVRDIAEFLNTSADDIQGVASFYNLIYRKPVGRHVILLCDSVSCWLTGYREIHEHLKSRLGIEMGQTTADDRFTLLPIVCLGACEKAPVMTVDGQVYGNLEPRKIDQILEGYK